MARSVTVQPLEQLHRMERGQNIINALNKMTYGAKRPITDGLRAFLASRLGHTPPASTVSGYMRTLKERGEALDHQLEFFEMELVHLLPAARSKADVKDMVELETIASNISGHGDHFRHAFENLQGLLGIDRVDVEALDESFLGPYFGYRRSTGDGGIIRFYVHIRKTAEPKLVSFENYFVRQGESWINRGFGFVKDGHLYLIGHARTHDGQASMGLRCFALVPYRWAGGNWLTGPILSVQYQLRTPISARVVLIPAADHNDFQLRHTMDQAGIFSTISQPVQADRIDATITRIAARGTVYSRGDRKVSDYVKFLIRNGTFSTVTAEARNLPSNTQDLAILRDIWDLEERLSHLWNNTGGIDDTGGIDGRYRNALNFILRDVSVG